MNPPATPERRLDPFALPTETQGRFLMLVAAALLVAWSLPSYFIEVPLFLEHLDQIPAEITQLTQKMLIEGFENLSREEMNRLYAWVDQHPLWGEAEKKQILRALCSLTAMLTVVIGAIFLAWFRLKERAPLLPEQAPTIYGELKHLARRLGLVPPPQVAVRPGFLDGEASGGRSGPVMVLAGDPRWLQRGWNDLSRAVMLHEIGHIVNHDFRVRELVRWVWIVLGLVVFGAILLLSIQGDFVALGRLTTRSLMLFATAWWLWAGLVRDRELYADQRVVTWGYGQALARRLSLTESYRPLKKNGSAGDPKGGWAKLRSWISGAHHPRNCDRLRALGAPHRFFLLSPKLAFLTGLLLAIPIANIRPLSLDILLPAGLISAPFILLPLGYIALPIVSLALFSAFFMVIAFLITRSLGLQTVRSALAQRCNNVSPRRALLGLGGPAMNLTGGFLLGLLPWVGPPVSVGSVLDTAAISMASAWGWLVVTYGMGRWVLGACSGPHPPRALIRLTSLTSTMLLVLFTWPPVMRWSLDALITNAAGAGLTPELQAVILTSLALTIATLSVLVLVIYLACSALAIRAHRAPCHRCGVRPARRQSIEATCPSCGAPLALWLYLDTFDLWVGFKEELQTPPKRQMAP